MSRAAITPMGAVNSQPKGLNIAKYSLIEYSTTISTGSGYVDIDVTSAAIQKDRTFPIACIGGTGGGYTSGWFAPELTTDTNLRLTYYCETADLTYPVFIVLASLATNARSIQYVASTPYTSTDTTGYETISGVTFSANAKAFVAPCELRWGNNGIHWSPYLYSATQVAFRVYAGAIGGSQGTIHAVVVDN